MKSRITAAVITLALGSWLSLIGAESDPGLLGHWSFENDLGPFAMDASPRELDAQIINAEVVQGSHQAQQDGSIISKYNESLSQDDLAGLFFLFFLLIPFLLALSFTKFWVDKDKKKKIKRAFLGAIVISTCVFVIVFVISFIFVLSTIIWVSTFLFALISLLGGGGIGGFGSSSGRGGGSSSGGFGGGGFGGGGGGGKW